MTDFFSDNSAGVHPAVLDAIAQANVDHVLAYGSDPHTAHVNQLFKKHFGDESETLLVLTGTGANVISLQSVTHSFEAIICADCSHLHNDECGAPEKLLGSKLLIAKTTEGKITIEAIAPLLRDVRMVHRSQPRVVSITQCTEWGTVYTIEEIKALADFCHNHNMYLHMDGSRLSNAVASLKTDFKSISKACGVDVLSLGGTKNGLMAAEAIVFINPKLAKHAEYYRKQSMQLVSKHRFLAAQFIAFFENDLWLKLAMHANRMAALLEEKVKNHVAIVMPVQSNVIFAKLPSNEIIEQLQTHYPFAVWDSHQKIVRWMTAFDTTEQDVISFAKAIQEIMDV